MSISKTLTNPSHAEFHDAIVEVSGNVLSEEWKLAAWTAATTWISGSLASSPYGYPIATKMIVSWVWDKSEHVVAVLRA